MERSFYISCRITKGEQYIDLRIQGGELDIDCIRLGEGCSQVPDIIQAEDFDEGKYQFRESSKGNFKTYRSDQGVAISASSNIIHISNTSGGDWIQYTFKVLRPVSKLLFAGQQKKMGSSLYPLMEESSCLLFQQLPETGTLIVIF